MNSSDPQHVSARSSEGADTAQLQAVCQRLQYLFVLSLASTVLICLAICVFMGKQYRTVQADLQDKQKSVNAMWGEYQRTTQPLIRDFVRGLQDYAARDRAFQPTLEKYHKQLEEYFLPSAAAATSTQPGGAKE